jgi:predicted MFS family arabinose efflux permease
MARSAVTTQPAEGKRGTEPAVVLSAGGSVRTRAMVALLTVAAFLIFAQAFMIAPILPRLAGVFSTGIGVVVLAVPAYLIPYGLMSLGWGPLADRFGRRPIIQACLAAFVVVTALTAIAPGVGAFIAARVAAGVVASGVVPVAVALIGDVVPYNERGHALGWLFAGMAGGMAVGSTAGALGEPLIGWQGLFIVVAVATSVTALFTRTWVPAPVGRPGREPVSAVVRGYLALLGNSRGRRTYGYVGLNAVLQSGIYTWLGVYLHQRYGLQPVGIGLALLGYGLPGFVFGPAIGRAADRYGRAWLIPAGVAVGAGAAFALAAPIPLAAAALTITVLSLSYDLTQPLLAGIVTDLPAQRGQSVALMAVILFCGFGAGSLVFQAVLVLGFTPALSIFAAVAAVAAGCAVPAFAGERSERPAGNDDQPLRPAAAPLSRHQ